MRTEKRNVALASMAAAMLALAPAASRADVIISEVAAHDRQIQPTGNGIASAGEEVLIRVGYASATPTNDYMFSILRWTLSTVPAGERAKTDGTVTLQVASDGGAFTGQTMDMYAIVSANAGWNESTPGDYASWDYRNSTTSVSGTPWPAGGSGLGNLVEGLGYGLTPLDSFLWTGQSTITMTVPESVINGWLTNPGGNAGILLRQQAETSVANSFLRLHSSEAGGGLEPTLSFSIPEPASAAVVLIGVAAMTLRRQRGA